MVLCVGGAGVGECISLPYGVGGVGGGCIYPCLMMCWWGWWCWRGVYISLSYDVLVGLVVLEGGCIYPCLMMCGWG